VPHKLNVTLMPGRDLLESLIVGGDSCGLGAVLRHENCHWCANRTL